MASFNSAIAVFILVLFNGCFTLPLDNSNLHDTNTVESQFISTTETNEHMGFDVSTPFFTSSDNDKRDYIDTVSTLVDESSTYMTGHQFLEKKHFEDSFSTSVDESSTDITEQQKNGKRDFDGSFSTTVESTTDTTEDQDNDKREIQTESTTNKLFSSPLVSSNVVAQLSTPQSLTSPSKGKKYTGLLPSDNEKQDEYVSQEGQDLESGLEPTKPTKYSKLIQKPTTEPELQPLDSFPSENGVGQNSTEAIPRLALYDQSPSDIISPNLGGIMTLDDNSTMIVTDLPTVLSTSANKIGKLEVSLNQGKKPLHTEKEESNN